MKKILFTLLFLLVAFPVYAYELLMFSNPHCGYCQKFLSEVAPTYPDTEYSKILPLKVIHTNEKMPEWVGLAFEEKRLKSIVATPTFVIWDNKEIARLEGYGGKEVFYEVLSDFIQKNVKEFDIPHESINAPEGVINSKDIFAHTYQTSDEALKASDWLGCNGNIHFHKKEQVWMPCSMH
jgi:thiol-disulfide isomerase/thioredoxin